MTVVPQGAPPAAPNEPELFPELAKLRPPPDWDVIGIYAKYVDIESKALKVGALERARNARAHQLALLGLAAARTRDGERNANGPSRTEEVLRELEDQRVERVPVLRCSGACLCNGAHDCPFK